MQMSNAILCVIYGLFLIQAHVTAEPCNDASDCQSTTCAHLHHEVIGYVSCERRECTCVTPCEPNPCQNHGTCNRHQDSYTCHCRHAYSGRHCESSACDDLPCRHNVHSFCHVTAGHPYYTCKCRNHFKGSNCDENHWCSDDNRCSNNGTCTPIDESPFYHCACPSGFSGLDCKDHDACSSNPCQHGATCHVKAAAPYFTCECRPANIGSFCEITQCKCNPDLSIEQCHVSAKDAFSRCDCLAAY